MKERIKDLKKINEFGINSDMFLKLVLHSTDGTSKQMTAYSNNYNIDGWKNEVFKEISTKEDFSKLQIQEFLNYMCKYYPQYFGRNKDEIYVTKQFEQYRRSEENFYFEKVVLLTMETL